MQPPKFEDKREKNCKFRKKSLPFQSYERQQQIRMYWKRKASMRREASAQKRFSTKATSQILFWTKLDETSKTRTQNFDLQNKRYSPWFLPSAFSPLRIQNKVLLL